MVGHEDDEYKLSGDVIISVKYQYLKSFKCVEKKFQYLKLSNSVQTNGKF